MSKVLGSFKFTFASITTGVFLEEVDLERHNIFLAKTAFRINELLVVDIDVALELLFQFRDGIVYGFVVILANQIRRRVDVNELIVAHIAVVAYR